MYDIVGRADWTGIPAATLDLNSQTLETTKPRLSSRLYHLNMVPVGGLIGQAFLPPPRRQRLDITSIFKRLERQKAAIKATFLCMLPVAD